MTDRERADARARELVACPKVPDATAADRMCPFGWNGCRRAAKCEAADEIADALMDFRREALEEAAKVADRCAWGNSNTQHLGPEQNCVRVAAAIRALIAALDTLRAKGR